MKFRSQLRRFAMEVCVFALSCLVVQCQGGLIRPLRAQVIVEDNAVPQGVVRDSKPLGEDGRGNHQSGPISLVLYSIDDLPVYRLDVGGAMGFDPSLLILQLTQKVQPKSWRSNQCSISVNSAAGALMIRQRASAHREIASVLQQIRLFNAPLDRGVLKDAVDQAQQSNRRVLLLVSRPTSEFAQALVNELEATEPSVTAQHYIPLYASPEQFAALKAEPSVSDATEWGEAKLGLWVLDGDGVVAGTWDVNQSELPKVFLERYAVPLPKSDSLFRRSLEVAQKTKRDVLVVISGPGCVHCQRLKALLAAHQQAFAKDHEIVLLDTRMQGVEALGKRLGRRDDEIPWYAVADASGNVKVTSESEWGNIGFPADDSDRDHFRTMFDRPGGAMNEAEIRRMMQLLGGQ